MIPGFVGFGIQYKNIVSPIAGFFGFTVQKATNVLLTVQDEAGVELAGVTVTYPSGGQTVTFTTSATSTLYELAIPLNATTTITLSRNGYVTQNFQVTVAANDFLTLTRTLVLAVVPYRLILRRN